MRSQIRRIVVFGLVITTICLVVALADVVRVVDVSMRRTLEPGDMVLVLRSGPASPFKAISRPLLRKGAIVLIRNQYLARGTVVKRIVATGGDRLRIDDGRLVVNGKVQEEPATVVRWNRSWPDAIRSADRDDMSVSVPEGHYFVLSDNRVTAMDSRLFGSVPEEDIVGVLLWQ